MECTSGKCKQQIQLMLDRAASQESRYDHDALTAEETRQTLPPPPTPPHLEPNTHPWVTEKKKKRSSS